MRNRRVQRLQRVLCGRWELRVRHELGTTWTGMGSHCGPSYSCSSSSQLPRAFFRHLHDDVMTSSLSIPTFAVPGAQRLASMSAQAGSAARTELLLFKLRPLLIQNCKEFHG